jgi:Peptidase family U32
MKTSSYLSALEAPVHYPSSDLRFSDGGQYRIEIPSCEGPEALAAVIEEAHRHEVVIHRVSQGSGIMMLTDRELREMLKLGREASIEVSLFVGPRAGFDVTPQPFTAAGKVIGCNLRGNAQLRYAIDDIKRGCSLGLRSILVGDIGLLSILQQLKLDRELPPDLVIKISLQLSVTNAATAKVLEDLGACTINVSPDLTLEHVSSIRAGIKAPIDVYIEVPDNFGGYIRYYEAPELIRVAAPIYLKLGLRNAPDIYPSGGHLQSMAVAMSRERVRRARLLVDLIRRIDPDAVASELGRSSVGIPVAV